MSQTIELARLPRILRERNVTTTYPACWRAVADGKIPAERIGARWFINPDDLDQIATTLAPR